MSTSRESAGGCVASGTGGSGGRAATKKPERGRVSTSRMSSSAR